ncbi:ABC-ATPase domain-containing protein [Kocuria sp. JC486]|uniref:ABC-ATPase domain-containing protein n=1 Tax=Kocuria sp. JC486 TaxID=1970736 RepID=UPI00141EDD7D|nr:ABC-ATPase domain-containing protein [Kocuria sp. JC486]NHU86234.1 ABC-ATPase domain-containing protein [Kocuria sp. JC486]
MRDLQALHRTLQELDGQGYGGYKRLKGTYDLGDFHLRVDRVQVDPYAPPSRMRAVFAPDALGLPSEATSTRDQRVATADHLARRFHASVGTGESTRGTGRPAAPRGRWGNGGSDDGAGAIVAYPCGPEILERSTVLIADDRIEVRFDLALPAGGRRIKGRLADRILTQRLPEVLSHALAPEHRDNAALLDHVRLYTDQLALQSSLAARGLVAFVGDGAILPRRAGDSSLPLTDSAVAFQSPPSLRTTFELPSGRTVSGMGVPEGITVVVGGGYHGKSTLLSALSSGVYPHIAGDGREWVLTRDDAVAVRSEDGRAVTGVDISPFISGLPTGVDTRHFTTTNASGSTSQAANLVEAIEASASVVLIDEDTSATNFMIRDERMKRLVPDHKEPITPFVERVQPMREHTGVSTVLVAGGSGAFFDVADLVIAMDSYRPQDVTQKARDIAADSPWGDEAEDADLHRQDVAPFRARTPRIVALNSLAPSSKTKPARSRGRTEIQLGRESIDLSAVSQLVDAGQTAAIACSIDRLSTTGTGNGTGANTSSPNMALERAAQGIVNGIATHGLGFLTGSPEEHPGHLVAPRQQEIQAAVNRYRLLKLANGSS